LILDVLLLFGVGIIAGVINTLAGGGSLLTLPVLIFLGLPPNVANGTNRIGILFNSIFAIRGFKSKGVKIDKYSIWLGLAAFPGALWGSLAAAKIEGELFNKILAGVIVMVVAYMLFGPKGHVMHQEKNDRKTRITGLFVFFLIGFYGGFIQAGIGYLIMASLTFINHFSLLKTNIAKVVIVLIYTLASIGVFIYEDLINWEMGLAMAIGSAVGGYLTSRWSVNKGDKWVRYFVMLTAVAFAIKLFFF
jgi:uncharacterized membrane protein YfcA